MLMRKSGTLVISQWSCLKTSSIDRIHSLYPPSDENRDDLLIPSFTTPKGFSLARAYETQIRTPCINMDWIWKHPMEPKLKAFFRLLWRDRIPHKRLLYHWQITSNSTCPRCGTHEDDLAHLIRNCPFSQDIWTTCAQPIDPNVLVIEWLKSNLGSVRSFRGFSWANTFPYLCHEIWKDRIECSLKDMKPTQPTNVIERAMVLVSLWTQAWAKYTNIGETPPPTQTDLLLNESCEMYINVDASFTHIVRNRQGEWVIGFSNRTYACNSFMAELKAIELELQIAQNHNIHSAILFSDCTQVINLLCHNDGFSDKYVSVLENCELENFGRNY